MILPAQLQYSLVTTPDGLQRLSMALGCLDRGMTEDALGHVDVRWILNCNGGGGAIAEEVRIDGVTESRFGSPHDPAIDATLAHRRGPARDPRRAGRDRRRDLPAHAALRSQARFQPPHRAGAAPPRIRDGDEGRRGAPHHDLSV